MKVLPRAASRAVLAMLYVVLVPALATAQEKRVLDHEAYDEWRTIQGERISDSGEWVLYTLAPRLGDGELVVRRTGGPEQVIPRAGSGEFTVGSGHALFTIQPAHDSVRALRLAETGRDDLPPDTLGILDLGTGEVTRIADVARWTLPEEGGSHVAYLLEQDTEATEDTAQAGGLEPEQEPEREPGAEPGSEFDEEPGSDDEEDDRTRHTLVLRELATGIEQRYEDVVEHVVSEDGATLAMIVAGEGEDGVVHVVDTGSGELRVVPVDDGRPSELALSADGQQAAFVAEHVSDDEGPSTYALHHWRHADAGARLLADAGSEGLPAGWSVSRHRTPSFSESGSRLFFGTAPAPEPEPEDSLLPEERVTLDVWHWQDDYLQPMQLLRADEERRRTYLAVAHLDRGDRIIQLETPDQPDVEVGREGDANVALAESNVPYRSLVGIEAPGFADLWLVDVLTGERTRVLERGQVRAHLSPDARYLAWYDYGAGDWYGMDVDDRRPVNLSAGIPHPVWDELDDHPMAPGPYGVAGWTEGDEALLIYDRFDIWAVDPEGRSTPRRVTEGVGRETQTRLRLVWLDRDERALDPSSPILLSAFDTRTKDAGFYRDRVDGPGRPEELVREPRRFRGVTKAENADVLLYTREDVSEFPDLWVADTRFRGATRLSDANPQQDEYNWATVELVEWLSNDGTPLQGLLYRPEDFDPAEEYPMMVYFYERNSDNLHQHAPPLPHRSVIQPTFYASRGYVVFVPDIVYRDGYPGESAMDAVMPGVLKLAAEPWVDQHNVGVQGHSWGGYQIAYMVTKTDFFKAAGAGAPVANMTSAYGGIRYGTGMSRMFQYERTQSRIGGSLWERPMQYFENSPLFFLESVNTPVLIMHNDQDGAVPWTQGIELFVGLRRLGKPAWLINYNDEPHWPTSEANKKDWNIRMQQYFDHFLMGAPAPRWLAEGIPATEKGNTLGLDLVPSSIATEESPEAVGGN